MNPVLAVVSILSVLTVSSFVIAGLDAVFSGGGGLRRASTAPLARSAQLISQRRSTTERPDAEAWALAPALLAGLGAVALAAIPLAPGLGIADVRAGIVLFGAAIVQVMVAVFLHGWAANSVFPLIGAYRMAAVALSMSIPFSLAVLTTAILAESLSVGRIIESQRDLWNVVGQPLGLPIYLITALGFAFWGPLRLPDAADLAGGTAAEVSGSALWVWRVARAWVLTALAAMGAAAFLGGYQGPVLPGWLWMTTKTAALLGLMVWAGHRFARPRMETTVKLGWLLLLPLALVDVFLTGALAL